MLNGRGFGLFISQPPSHHLQSGGDHVFRAVASWQEFCNFVVGVWGGRYTYAPDANSFVNVIDVLVSCTAPVSYFHLTVFIDHSPHGHCFDRTIGCSE
jgi:hypothetical protein